MRDTDPIRAADDLVRHYATEFLSLEQTAPPIHLALRSGQCS